MSGGSKKRVGWPVLAAIPLALMISGCAAGNKSVSGTEAGMVLKYRMPSDRVLKYLTTHEYSQSLKVEGRPVEFSSHDTRLFSLDSKGRDQDKYRVGITIDSINIILKTPQGAISPDLEGLAGQGFEFNLTAVGRETDFPEPESLRYELVPGDQQSAVAGFKAFFPDLPSRPVKIGDTWISLDTIIEKTPKGELCIILESKNKLEGFETIDGLKCARISADIKGTLDGKGEELGMELTSRAKIKGADTWYFAYEEGIFVKSQSKGVGEGKITGIDPQKIEIPMKREYSMETWLLK